ncbi:MULTISPECIES: glycosyltransferase family 2 protein [Actinosynnema]|uniref:glycosyltransferase family 2 protein n=1 Tax=Actinosynnema TaxID=40566 RepID=UPI0020A59C86|nr:glycosyltransferase family 2 protein [Actinosynnema pretiosum]MCP2095568.1 Glycosyl transferase family 2 [Actinosynnema pretiosum]
MDLPLVGVIGPVEPDLLESFVEHYRALGVTRFLLGFHFTDDTPADRAQAVLRRHRRLLGEPALVHRGVWDTGSTTVRDRLRALAGPGWTLLADSDEFQAWPAPPREVLAGPQARATGTVGGLMLDRVAADGALPPWPATGGHDRLYPLGGFLTHLLLHADPRKIVAARGDVRVAVGNHRAPGHRPTNHPPVAVHHFKWRAGVLDYLRRRVDPGTARFQHSLPSVHAEATLLLAHAAAHAGRLATTDPALPLLPVTLADLPGWWPAQARQLVDTWRPHHQRTPETNP